MPTYIDLHNVPEGVTPKDLALAHLQDLDVQTKHGVTYLRYWFDLDRRKVNCLVDAPSREAAIAVRSEAHGLLADEIIAVETGSVEDLLGRADEAPAWTPEWTAPPPAESPFRTILFTDMEGSAAFTQRLGDAEAMEVVRAHNGIVREALERHGGREVSTPVTASWRRSHHPPVPSNRLSTCR